MKHKNPNTVVNLRQVCATHNGVEGNSDFVIRTGETIELVAKCSTSNDVQCLHTAGHLEYWQPMSEGLSHGTQCCVVVVHGYMA